MLARMIIIKVCIMSYLLACCAIANAISPQEVLVVYNNTSSIRTTSHVIANYYAEAIHIPQENIIGLYCYTSEGITETQYKNDIAFPLWNDYLSKPEYSHIKCIVLCYGVPSIIASPSPEIDSAAVDCALTLLGNTDYLDKWHLGTWVHNPYRLQNTDFTTFRESSANAVNVSLSGQSYTWKLNYLVCRLDALEDPKEKIYNDGFPLGIDVPRDVKALIDRSSAATSGGKYVVDDTPYIWYNGPGTRTELNAVGIDDFNENNEPNIITDATSTFLTGNDCNDVMCYIGEHVARGNADCYTTWGRPLFSSWHPGGIALNSINDGQSYRTPLYFWGSPKSINTTPSPGILKVINFRPALEPGTCSTDQYASHQIVLCDSNRNVMHYTDGRECRATFNWGTAEMSLADIVWPSNHISSVEIRFPVNDPMFKDKYIPSSRTGTNESIYNASGSGITFDCHWVDEQGDDHYAYARTLSSAYISEGASGTIAMVDEGENAGEPIITFPRYAAGYTLAESAYMSILYLGSSAAVLGDPLMAPNAVEPSIYFEEPTPDDNATVNGCVTLCTSALPEGNGSINRVEFWAKLDNQPLKLINVDTQAPFEHVWNTQEMKDGSRVYLDGNYTIQAIAQQTGARIGSKASSPLHVVLSSGSCPTVTLENPSTDWPQSQQIIDPMTNISASASPDVSEVDFWLIGDQGYYLIGSSSGPDFTLQPNLPLYKDGVYDLVAVGTSGQAVAYSERRRVFVKTGSAINSIAELYALADGASICLIPSLTAGPVVTAGTSPRMDGGIYLSDLNDLAAIRVETSASIATGRIIALKGTLRKSLTKQGDVERYITPEYIWDVCDAPQMPRPIGMANYNYLGGASPDAGLGLTQSPCGPYNIGQLVKVWGRVNYIEQHAFNSDFFYIDDGSGLIDSSSIKKSDGSYQQIVYNPVPLNGAPIISGGAPVPGVRVRTSGTAKVRLGDFVAVTGISSCFNTDQTAGSHARCVRTRDDQDITFVDSYTSANPLPDGSFSASGISLPNNSKVRIFARTVSDNSGNEFAAQFSYYPPPTYFNVNVLGQTALPVGSINLVILGAITGVGEVKADFIYVGADSSPGIGAFSLGAPAWSASVLSVPTRSENVANILSNVSFQRQDSRPNCIGWALSQPDGSVVDLIGEYVTSRSADGGSFGIKETFEPSTGHPRLVLNLPVDVPQLTPFSTIDIIGGRLATLSNGQRALLYPQAVYVNTTAAGNLQPPMWSKQYDSNDSAIPWQWRDQVYP